MKTGNTIVPNNPWGQMQTQKTIAPGIVFITTASHGGFYVAPEQFAKMPKFLRENTFAGGPWFEEDVDWSLVALAFPALFTEEELKIAESTLRAFHAPRVPAYLAWKSKPKKQDWKKEVYEGLGMKKVKGNLGGTYYE